MKVELDLFNHATKANLKNATEVDTSDFAKITDFANLKSDVDKLDIDKLKNVPSELIKKIITIFSTNPFIFRLAFEIHCFHGHA